MTQRDRTAIESAALGIGITALVFALTLLARACWSPVRAQETSRAVPVLRPGDTVTRTGAQAVNLGLPGAGLPAREQAFFSGVGEP